jgi:hypothetical protein
MSFLFEKTGAEQVNKILQNYSMENYSNVFHGVNKYVVYRGMGESRDSTVAGTNRIKEYLQGETYKRDNEKNPYLTLIEEFKSYIALQLKAADLAYLKDLGVYPINRMAILRRFPEGYSIPENLMEIKDMAPISTIIGWIKSDENFGKIRFNETWKTTDKRFDILLSEIVTKQFGINITAAVPLPDFLQGLVWELFRGMGLTDNTDEESAWGALDIPVGDPNVLHEGPYKDPNVQNIQSSFSFDIKTTYEQKLLGDVDPGSAMLDIIDNIFAMGTSNMKYYWSENSKIMIDARTASQKKANDTNEWWKFIVDVAQSFWKQLEDLFKDIKVYIENMIEKAEKIVDKYKSEEGKNSEAAAQAENTENTTASDNKSTSKYQDPEFKDKVDLLIKSILTSTISIHRYELRGTIELMTGGRYSTTPWHLTIGNPYSPWISTNHIVIESCEIETGTEMGFNDMPQNITATFSCRFSRSLGKQELMRMFNNSYKRTYSYAVAGGPATALSKKPSIQSEPNKKITKRD